MVDKRHPKKGAGSASIVNAPKWEQTAERLSQPQYGLKGLVLAGNHFEPLYRDGTLLYIKPGTGTPPDHVVVVREALPPLIGQLVRMDENSLHVQGFNPGDQVEAVALESASLWGRIVVAFKPLQ